jgi:SAM-dependent methyltransferase
MMVRSAIPPSIMQIARRPLHRAVSDLGVYQSPLFGKRALEIGGPTLYFDDRGILPVYSILKSVDNCLFSRETIWTGTVPERFRYHPKKSEGRQFICDGTDLKDTPSGDYECLLSSHCLEHIANPLRALAEWKRVLTDDGLLLMILPHKEVTFDWRRPVTPLAHIIDDFERGVGEDDATHFEEILRLHDLSKTPQYATPEAFRTRCLENITYRAMHQHVFNTHSVIELMNYAGLQILQVDAIKPGHIVILAKKCKSPDDGGFLAPDAAWRSRSAFTSDQKRCNRVPFP